LEREEEIGDKSVVIARIYSHTHIQEHLLRQNGQGIKMYSSVKSHNIRDMTKEMEQVKTRVKIVTLPTSSTSSTGRGSACASASASMPHIPTLPKRRGSIP